MPTLTSGEQLPAPCLAVALLAHVAAAIESGLHCSSWRNPTAGDARWLYRGRGRSEPIGERGVT